jgi:hypothetical protein
MSMVVSQKTNKTERKSAKFPHSDESPRVLKYCHSSHSRLIAMTLGRGKPNETARRA